MKESRTSKTVVKKVTATDKSVAKNGKKPTAPSDKKPMPGKKK